MSSNGSSASESLESSSSLTELALIATRTHNGCSNYIGRRTQHHTVGISTKCVCAKPCRLIFCMLCSYTTPTCSAVVEPRTPRQTTNFDRAVACQTPCISCAFVLLPRSAYQALTAPYGNEAAAPLLSRICCTTSQRVPRQVACATMHSCSTTYLLDQVCSRRGVEEVRPCCLCHPRLPAFESRKHVSCDSLAVFQRMARWRYL